jgi:hypothetical protein
VIAAGRERLTKLASKSGQKGRIPLGNQKGEIMEGRNWRQEMNELIEAEPIEGKSASLIADQLLVRLQNRDPDLLAGWLMLNAHSILTQHISKTLANKRQTARRVGKVGRFATATERYERGDRSALDDVYVTTENQIRRRLGALTAVDCKYIADSYTKRGNALLFESVVFAALARKIPDGLTLEEALTEEEYIELRHALESA